MFLTTEAELVEITDEKLTYNLVRRMSHSDKETYSSPFFRFAHDRVVLQMTKRFHKKKYFENQKHAFRYVCMIVYKQSLSAWYNRSDKETYTYDSAFFSGEYIEGLGKGIAVLAVDECSYKSSEHPDVDKALNVVGLSMQKDFGDIALSYIDHKVRGADIPSGLTYRMKINLDLVFEHKIREYAKNL